MPDEIVAKTAGLELAKRAQPVGVALVGASLTVANEDEGAHVVSYTPETQSSRGTPSAAFGSARAGAPSLRALHSLRSRGLRPRAGAVPREFSALERSGRERRVGQVVAALEVFDDELGSVPIRARHARLDDDETAVDLADFQGS